MGARGEGKGFVDRVLGPYTGVGTSGTNERALVGVKGTGPVVAIRGKKNIQEQ